MCIGVPMRVLSIDGLAARCEDGDGGTGLIDLSLVADARPGDWILTFLGAARQRLDPAEAARIRDALRAVAAALRGEDPGDAFADLVNREPALPPHLAAARAAGLTEA